MEILHKNEQQGEFYIEKDGDKVASLLYFHSRDGEINVHHTEVSDQLAGQGIGKKLVAEAVKYARKNGLKILPTCPFAAKVIDKTPEFQDVLAGGSPAE
jgi:predicted GNAT family acetyltransferase